MLIRKNITLLFFILATISSFAQPEITIDDLTSKNTFQQKTVTGIRWLNDGKFYTSLRDNKILKYDVSTGQSTATIYDGDMKIDGYSFSDDETKLLLSTNSESIYRRSSKSDFYIYDVTSKSTRKLSNG